MTTQTPAAIRPADHTTTWCAYEVTAQELCRALSIPVPAVGSEVELELLSQSPGIRVTVKHTER